MHPGQDSYSPVSTLYFKRAPFRFDGEIEQLRIKSSSTK
jgi:hypothetical protein